MKSFTKRLVTLTIFLLAGSVNAAPITLEFASDNNLLLPYQEDGFIVTALGGPGSEGVADSVLYDNHLADGEIISFTRAGGEQFSFLAFDILHLFTELHSTFRFIGLLNDVQVWSSGIFAFPDQGGFFQTIGGFNSGALDEFRIVGAGTRDELVIWDNFVFNVERDTPDIRDPEVVNVAATNLLILISIAGLIAMRFKYAN